MLLMDRLAVASTEEDALDFLQVEEILVEEVTTEEDLSSEDVDVVLVHDVDVCCVKSVEEQVT